MIIQLDSDQMEIGSPCVVANLLHKSQFVIGIGSNIWNNLPTDIKGNSQISYNVFVRKIKLVLRDKQC